MKLMVKCQIGKMHPKVLQFRREQPSEQTVLLCISLTPKNPSLTLQGFIPNFARIGSFNLVLWSSYEAIKSAFAPSSAGI